MALFKFVFDIHSFHFLYFKITEIKKLYCLCFDFSTLKCLISSGFCLFASV